MGLACKHRFPRERHGGRRLEVSTGINGYQRVSTGINGYQRVHGEGGTKCDGKQAAVRWMLGGGNVSGRLWPVDCVETREWTGGRNRVVAMRNAGATRQL